MGDGLLDGFWVMGGWIMAGGGAACCLKQKWMTTGNDRVHNKRNFDMAREGLRVARVFQSRHKKMIHYRCISLVLVMVGILSGVASAFSPLVPNHFHDHGHSTTSATSISRATFLTSLHAKRKMSMTEKRKRRQAKNKEANPFADLPKSKLDFQTAQNNDGETSTVDKPIRASNPEDAANKAKQLLRAQQDSVNMLTRVRERVEAIPADDLLNSLESKGYFVLDDFLDDPETIEKLQTEALALYEGEEMEADITNLGSGEYLLAIEGGEKQYARCPRMVELVVSTTKHIPEPVANLSLDPSACQAILRTYDRSVFKASLALLTGGSSPEEENVISERSYGKIVGDSVKDLRRLTMNYFIVPPSWEESSGGGLQFENQPVVAAKRDRLVLWKSDSAVFRNIPWKGDDDMNGKGSVLELHLVEIRA